MKKTDLYEIAFKLFGLYLIINSLNTIRDIITYSFVMQNPEFSYRDLDKSIFILNTVYLGVTLLFGSLLIFKTAWVTRLFTKPADEEPMSGLIADPKVMYEMALVIMGLFLILTTLPDLLSTLKTHIQLVQTDMQTNEYDIMFIFSGSVKIIVGAISVGFARSIGAFLGKDRKLNHGT